MKSFSKLIAAVVAACFTAAVAFAADANPSGKWKWTQPSRGGGPGTERTFTLDYKDGKLTGKLAAASMGQFEIPETAISDASFKDGVVAFSVTIDMGGTPRTTKYSGKLEGDKITGSTERPGRDGGVQKSDWVATRAK